MHPGTFSHFSAHCSTCSFVVLRIAPLSTFKLGVAACGHIQTKSRSHSRQTRATNKKHLFHFTQASCCIALSYLWSSSLDTWARPSIRSLLLQKLFPLTYKMAGIWDTVTWFFGANLPEPTSPHLSTPRSLPGSKRKATGEDGRRSKLRRVSAIHAELHNAEDESENTDFYDGHARDVYRAFTRGYSTSFDGGVQQGVQTLTQLSDALKSRQGKRMIKLVGQKTDDLNDTIEQLPVREHTKNKVADKVAHLVKERLSSLVELSEDAQEPAVHTSGLYEELASLPDSPSTVGRVDLGELDDWNNNPVMTARALLEKNNFNKEVTKRAIADSMRHSVGRAEPQYVLRDAEIRDSLWQVMDKMERFARRYFDYDWPEDDVILKRN